MDCTSLNTKPSVSNGYFQSSRNSSYSTQEEVELLIVGCVGTAVCILGLLAIWLR